MELEEGDLVLCTVDRIIGTVVFVKIDGQGDLDAGIITSEIAPGRIRNLRDYVVPKKRIVCKVLRVKGKNIELSLRRVTPKEKKEVLEQASQEKSLISIFKSILGDKAESTINIIIKESNLVDFSKEIKEDANKLIKLVGEDNAKKILDILKKEKIKKLRIKKEIILKTKSSHGLTDIKELLLNLKDIDVRCISAGRYSLSIESSNFKVADQYLQHTLKELEKKAKKLGMEFEIKEK